MLKPFKALLNKKDHLRLYQHRPLKKIELEDKTQPLGGNLLQFRQVEKGTNFSSHNSKFSKRRHVFLANIFGRQNLREEMSDRKTQKTSMT